MNMEFRRLLTASAMLALLPAEAMAAGGAFVVDDSEIGKPGECKVESWASAAANHDFVGVTSPACVVKLGIPVELNGQFTRARSDSVWSTGGLLKGKATIIPADNHPFGLAIEAGSSWDLISGANTGSFAFVPVTFQLRDDFKINVNAGWMYDGVAKINYFTWGAGFEWIFVNPKILPLTLIGEVFGQDGKLAPVDPDAAPSNNSVREPRAQLGLRYTPVDKVDIDLIWGRNITGENSNWVTLGLNLRF